ncbi:MAG: DUF4292 domain-containing protein [Bacteroidota bacterium]
MNNPSLLPIIKTLCLSALIGIGLFFQGCKTSKKATTALEKEESAAYLLEKLAANQVDADWFSAKAKVRYEDSQQSVSASSTIKFKRDSVLWMNVKKFGLEIARMLITKDSIFVINRFERSYIATDLQWVQNQYNLPANLSILQSVLLGNPIFFTRDSWTTAIENNAYSIKSSDSKHENAYWMAPESFLLTEMELRDKWEGRSVKLGFEGYEAVDQTQNFSYIRQLQLKSNTTGDVKVDLEFSKVEINVPKSIRFEIPKRYTPATY